MFFYLQDLPSIKIEFSELNLNDFFHLGFSLKEFRFKGIPPPPHNHKILLLEIKQNRPLTLMVRVLWRYGEVLNNSNMSENL